MAVPPKVRGAAAEDKPDDTAEEKPVDDKPVDDKPAEKPTEEPAAVDTRVDWLNRRTETHCVRGPRDVTGADMVRISRTLAVEPWRFTEAGPAAVADPAGIVVDSGRRRVAVSIANASYGCVFLLRAAGGSGRCGLGGLAPVCCRVFPADPKTDEQAELAGSGLTEEELKQLRQTWAEDQAHWLETIARWNKRKGWVDPKTPLELMDFQRYLLETVAAREAGTAWPEEVTV